MPDAPGNEPAPREPATAERFVSLYAEAASTLFAWANLRLRPALRAFLEPEDLVSEICFRAFDRFRTFDPGKGTFRRWLFGIANNVLREALDTFAGPRGRARKPPGWSESPLANLPDEATSVSRRAARDEGLRQFVERLQELDDDDRRLLLYRGLEDLSHSEIGGLLNLSRDAVEKRWQRLQKRIEPWAPPPDLFGS